MRSYILIYLSLMISSSLWAQQTLSLANCLKAAEQHSPILAQQALIQESLLAQSKRLNRNYWPQLEANGRISWQSDIISLPIDIAGLDVPSPTQEQYRFSLDLQQTIWDGGINKAQKAERAANSAVDILENQLSFHQLKGAIEQLFFTALLAEQQSGIIAVSHQDISSQRQRLQAAADNGIATLSDVQQLSAKLIELEHQQIELAQIKTSTLAALSIWMGQELSADTQLTAPDLSFSKQALQTIELELLAANRYQIDQQKELIKASNRPKAGAYANLGYGQPGLNALSSDWDSYLTAGIQVNIPLSHFYNSSQSLDLQQLQLAQEQIQLQEEQHRMQASTQQIQQEEKLKQLNIFIDKQAELVALRQDIKTTAELQLEQGIITTTDYLSAVNNEEIAKQQALVYRIQKMQAISTYNWLSQGSKPSQHE